MKRHNFANRLQKALDDNGFKQIDLVNKTKIDKTLINKYLSGVSEPKQDKLEILANALGVNEVWLMGYDVPKEPLEDPFGINMINNDMGRKYINTAQLSIITGIDSNEISDIVSGKNKIPKPSLLKEISRALNKRFYDYLIGFGYVEDPENMHNFLYESGVRYLLDYDERMIICNYLSETWNHIEDYDFKKRTNYKHQKNIYTPEKVYSVIFDKEKKVFTNDEVKTIIEGDEYRKETTNEMISLEKCYEDRENEVLEELYMLSSNDTEAELLKKCVKLNKDNQLKVIELINLYLESQKQ